MNLFYYIHTFPIVIFYCSIINVNCRDAVIRIRDNNNSVEYELFLNIWAESGVRRRSQSVAPVPRARSDQPVTPIKPRVGTRVNLSLLLS